MTRAHPELLHPEMLHRDALFAAQPATALSSSPAEAPEQYERATLAAEYLHADPDRRRVLRGEILRLHNAEDATRKVDRELSASRASNEEEKPERSPGQILATELLAQSLERRRLGLVAPPALRPGKSTPSVGELRYTVGMERERIAAATPDPFAAEPQEDPDGRQDQDPVV